MTVTLPSTLLDTRPRPDELPILRVETADPAGWVALHRDALRAATVDHGAVLVRGLDIDDATRVGAILHRLGAPPVTERRPSRPATRTRKASTPRRSGPRTNPCACTTNSATPTRSRR